MSEKALPRRAVRVRTPERLPTLITPIVLMVLVAAVVLVAGSSSSAALKGAAATAGVYVVLSVGLYTFVGTTGILSFGHMAMMGIGGYVAAICASQAIIKESTLLEMPGWIASIELSVTVSLLVGAAAAALFASIVSVPLVRLRGLAASLATFAVLLVVNNVLTNASTITGGVTGYSATPIDTTPGKAVIWALLAILVAFLFRESRVGLRLRSSREDEVAALGVGANVKRDRAIAFTISGAIVGIGGGLTALQVGAITPSVFYLNTTFVVIVMIVVGGVNSLSGAVVGSLLMSAVGYVLGQVQSGNLLGFGSFEGRAGIETAGLAIIALAVLLLRPQGLMGSREIGDLRRADLPFRRTKRAEELAPGSPGDT